MGTQGFLIQPVQVALPAPPSEVLQRSLDRDIQDSFEEFHRANPNVYTLLVKFARQAKAAGMKKYGIASLFERLRWHISIELKSEQAFKLNNNFRSRYARLIMEHEPDLDGFFELRELKNGVVQ
jgi:hypothetical protein